MGINISISPPVSGTPRVLFRGCHPHEHCPCIWSSGTVQILPVLPVSLFHGHDSIDTYAVFLIVYPEENGELPGDMHAIPDNTFRSMEPFDVPLGRPGLFETVEMFPDNTKIFFFETFTELQERCPTRISLSSQNRKYRT